MADLSATRLWLMRAAFGALALCIMFFHLLPLDTQPRGWAPPDLLIAFTFAWAMRRPDYVPVLLIAGITLLADLLFQRPPGLMAALVVVACEYLKTRFGGLRDASFAGEWLAVCVMIVAVTVLNRLVLLVMAVDMAPLGLTLIQMVLTMLAYPLVALVTGSLMGVRRLTPSDADSVGGRA